MSQPRLLMVTTVASTLRAFLLPFAAHYRTLGWRVDALASGASECEQCRSGFDHVFETSWSRNPLSLWNNVRAASDVREVAKRGQYDIIHVHTPVAAMVTRIALHRRDRRPEVVYTAHGFHFFHGGGHAKNLAFTAIEKIAGRWTDALVVINGEDEASARRLAIVREERLFYFPGIGVDLDRFDATRIPKNSTSELRSELNVGSHEVVFLQVADFVRRKRHGDLLRAFAVLPVSAKLLLAGEGPELKAMVLLARNLGISDRVRFLGIRGDIPELMKLADAVLLVSEQEGLPRCVLEAMAMARPIVGTQVRGTKELVGGCGILVPVGDIAAITRAMLNIMEFPARAQVTGMRGRELVAKYDQAHVIRLHDSLYELLLSKPMTRPMHGCQEGLRRLVKVGLDRAVATLALILSAPLWAAAAVAIRCSMGAPVFFRQERPGYQGSAFTLIKFRTMADARDKSGELLPDADRLTRVGRLLRATSVDELPQLLNVLRDEMSLVGPRPLLTQYLKRYTPEQVRRHEVLPGITGWAQVNGRNSISWEEKLALDIWYVDNWSLLLDVRILARTLRNVILRRGIRNQGHATMPEFLGRRNSES